MITYLSIVVTLTFFLLIRILLYLFKKETDNQRMLNYLENAEKTESQTWEVLKLVKEWRESARVQHKEADVAKSEIVATAKTITQTIETKSEELSHKIEEVPGKVTEKIAESITKVGESGILSKPQSNLTSD